MYLYGRSASKHRKFPDFLKSSPRARCVYHCDNDVVDYQVAACEFANGITASHMMTAFDCGRGIETVRAVGSAQVPLAEHGGGVAGCLEALCQGDFVLMEVADVGWPEGPIHQTRACRVAPRPETVT